MMQHELIYREDELFDVANELQLLFSRCSIFTFTGTLGAGKTTLIQALLRSSGVEEPVQSPTFSYVHRYVNARGEEFYHFDLYRLSSIQEFYEQGFQEPVFQPRSWSFIEWPEIIMPLLMHSACHVSIQYHGRDQRKLMYTIV